MRTLLLIAALVLSACATPYGRGTDAQAISGDIMRISARGNGWTDAATVSDFVLLRAAEEAMKRKYAGFVVLGSTDASKSGQFTTGGSAYTTGSVNSFGGFNAHTTYSPGQTYIIHKPGRDIYVRMLRSAELENTPGALKAVMVWNNLAPRYIKSR